MQAWVDGAASGAGAARIAGVLGGSVRAVRPYTRGRAMAVPTLAYLIGARPNIVKMAPVMAALRRRMPAARHVLIHTGQHYDPIMSDVLLEQLEVPPADHSLGVGSGTHAEQTARVMERLEPVLLAEQPDLLLVPGDVNSTAAAAMVAAKLLIGLAHVESGLRSFDRTMPEEINRIVTDTLADLLFTHCDEAGTNLASEGIAESRIHLVGNTMIDSLVAVEPAFRGAQAARRFGLTAGDYLLVTLHRPNLVDGPLLPVVLEQLSVVARTLPVLFPAHPRTQKMLAAMELPPGVAIVDPLPYIDFLSAEADAAGVLTDSGGVQEETTYLGVPCFTLRDNTERPITIRLGTNHLLGLDPQRIGEIVELLGTGEPPPAGPPPLWDGAAGDRVAAIVETVTSGALLPT
jgi:UDP-N-acetylglucosamine 2-epimerase (non-hydrolysing)